MSRFTSPRHQRAAIIIAPRARMTGVHTSPKKAPSGKPKGGVEPCPHTCSSPTWALALHSVAFHRSRVRASLSSDRPGRPLSVFRRAGAATCVCADAAPNERARTSRRNLSRQGEYTPGHSLCQALCGLYHREEPRTKNKEQRLSTATTRFLYSRFSVLCSRFFVLCF